MKHKFPDKLYFENGTALPKFIQDYVYYTGSRPLKDNEEYYGYGSDNGAWNLIVRYENGKYITEHYMDHLNEKELFKERP